jgi:hypothetical protein
MPVGAKAQTLLASNEAFVWSILGVAASLILAAIAWMRSRGPAGHYDGDVYGMTGRTHWNYGLAALVLAVLFGVSFVRSELSLVPLWAVAAILAVLYGTSFLRGAEADD